MNYAELMPTGQKRVDAGALQQFERKAELFESKMGPRLLDSSASKEIVRDMMSRVAHIVDSFADHIGKTRNEVYQSEFKFRQGDQYYGAFLQTAENVRKVLHNAGNQPLRLQLKLIYNAVRNNNLAKWLKVAADELRGRQTAATMGDHGYRVSRGFAKDSGLKKVMRKNDGVRDAANAAADHERRKADDGRGGKVDIQANDRSELFDAKAPVVNSRIAKRYNANEGLTHDDQETVTRGDLPDLTVGEIQQLRQNQGKGTAVNGAKRDRFVAKAGRKIPWEQGREAIDVYPNSEVERQATAIHARLDAGISGSTDLMMHAAQNLGFTSMSDLRRMRVALVGWMLANRDHSFYEIMKAAEAYGPAFVTTHATKPAYFYEAPENFKPFDVKKLKTLLPERQFPGYFLSGANKDALAQVMAQPDLMFSDLSNHLRNQGIPNDVLAQLGNQHDRESLAFLELLSSAVQAAAFDAAGTAAAEKKNRWLRRALRRSVAFLHVVHKYPVHADVMLSSLIHHHHPAAETRDDRLMVAGAAQLMPIANATNPHVDALRTELVNRGVPEQAVADVRKCPNFVIEQIHRLDGMIAGAAFDTTGAVAAHANNVAALADVRGTRLWADLCNFFNQSADAEGGVMSLVLHGLLRHRHPGLERIVYETQSPEKQYAMQKGVPDIALRNLDAGDYRDLRALLDAVANIVIGAATADQKRAALSALQADPNHGYIRSRLRTWFLAVVAAVARVEGLDIDPDAQLRLAGDTALLVRPGAMQEAPVDLSNALNGAHYGWNANGGARGMLQTNIDSHRNDVASAAKTQIDNSAVALGNLSDAELHGINQYTRLAGMGSWQTALDERDYTLGKRSMDKLSGAMPRMKAAVSGLNRLPVYSAGDVFCGKEWPNDLARDDAAVNRFLQRNYPLGKVTTRGSFLSSAKTKERSFAYTHANYDLLWIIQGIKSGRDVQMISHNEHEEEVLFPPGWRFVVEKVENNLNNGASPYQGKVCIYLTEV